MSFHQLTCSNENVVECKNRFSTLIAKGNKLDLNDNRFFVSLTAATFFQKLCPNRFQTLLSSCPVASKNSFKLVSCFSDSSVEQLLTQKNVDLELADCNLVRGKLTLQCSRASIHRLRDIFGRSLRQLKFNNLPFEAEQMKGIFKFRCSLNLRPKCLFGFGQCSSTDLLIAKKQKHFCCFENLCSNNLII